MLIDVFADNPLHALRQRAQALPPAGQLHLLIDGAFAPGLHRRIRADRKALLFDGLPGSGPQALDVSPFLTPFAPDDRLLAGVLGKCRGWPMLSLIETPEPWPELAARLAPWCIIENDGQRFNFRFADTRRLPAILKTLDVVQRRQLAGPSTSWTYIAREGAWHTLALDGSATPPASDPQLSDAQFAALVEDGRADEVLARLDAHPHRGSHSPSQAYAMVSSALKPALQAGLDDGDTVDWCGWLLALGYHPAVTDIAGLFDTWKTQAASNGGR